MEIYDTTMFVSICVLTLALSIVLYQLTLSTESLSYSRLLKFLFEFLANAVQYYCLCHYSEVLDDCRIKLCRAVGYSAWYQCSNRTQRDLCFLLRQLQRPNHLTFVRGYLVLTKDFFVSMVKCSYSFVSLMRVKTK